ncbi:histidinol-phosphatase HisJ family protein [Fusibacter sp. JL298sf-3]
MKPFKMDFHVHSDFSSDSKAPMEEMLQAAIDQSVTHIAFTEHVDYDSDPSLRTTEWDFDQPAYFNQVEAFNRRYDGVIKLHYAAEIGLQEISAEKNDALCKAYPFDFILASLHTLEKKDVYLSPHFTDGSAKTAIQTYFEAYFNNICAYDNYDVLGHLDLYLRYHPQTRNVPFSAFSDYVETLLKKVIESGKGIEVNAGGHRYNLGHNNPDTPILKLYKDLGGEIITLGSDAHSTGYVAHAYEANVAHLKALGFQYACTFEKRQPVFHKL